MPERLVGRVSGHSTRVGATHDLAAFYASVVNGTEVTLDSSFERFIDVTIKGLEQTLQRPVGA